MRRQEFERVMSEIIGEEIGYYNDKSTIQIPFAKITSYKVAKIIEQLPFVFVIEIIYDDLVIGFPDLILED